MSLKDEELYQKYLLHLESKSLTKGGFELSKISQSLFEEFQSRYENNPSFNLLLTGMPFYILVG